VAKRLGDRFRAFFRRMAESDEQRLAKELQEWSASIPGTVRIASAPARQRIRIAGAVRRITIRPVEGFEALEAVIYDGTGEVTAVWLGRRAIHGLVLGSKLILEGVLGEFRGERRMVNPTFEFA
jgi:hypothetical protein